jgi:hypothetical protein
MIVISWKTKTSEHGFTTDKPNWDEAEKLIASLEADPNIYDIEAEEK